MPSEPQPSSLTHEEIGAALQVAADLDICVCTATGNRRLIREMEMAQILEVVFDGRAKQLHGRLEAEREAIEQKVQRAERELEDLRDEIAETIMPREILAAWEEVLPLIQASGWYKAAQAVNTLEDLVDRVRSNFRY